MSNQNHFDNKKALFFSLFLVFLAQFVTATTITGSKYLIEYMPIVFIMQIRFIIGAIFLGIVFTCSGDQYIQNQVQAIRSFRIKQWLSLIIIGLCGGAFFQMFMFIGLQFTTATMAGVITSALPAVVSLLMFVILGVRLTRLKVMCITLAVIGLLLININGLVAPDITPLNLLGDFVILLSMIPEGLYYVFVKLFPLRISALTGSMFINAINAIVLIPIMFFIHYHFLVEVSVTAWLVVGLLGVFSGIFYLAWAKGSEHLDPSSTGMITATMPLCTLILSWLFLNENITLLQGIAMGVIVVSVIIGNWKKS